MDRRAVQRRAKGLTTTRGAVMMATTHSLACGSRRGAALLPDWMGPSLESGLSCVGGIVGQQEGPCSAATKH